MKTARSEQAGTGLLGLGVRSGGLLLLSGAGWTLGQALAHRLTRPPCSSAYDARLRQKVAVKKLSRPFQSLIHARRTYRELRLLKHLKHENVRGRASGVGIEQRTPPGGGGSEVGGVGPLEGTPPYRRGPDQWGVAYSCAVVPPRFPVQIIGLLDVFTPATSIEDFSEV